MRPEEETTVDVASDSAALGPKINNGHLLGDINMRVEIPSNKVDLVMGSGVVRIQEETGVFISALRSLVGEEFPAEQPEEPKGLLHELTPFMVRGPIGGVFQACERIESIIPDFVVNVVASFQVRDKRDIAGIIGTGGSTVNRLEQATQCHISTPPKHDPSRVITVQGGSGQQVFTCLEMLAGELNRMIHPYHAVNNVLLGAVHGAGIGTPNGPMMQSTPQPPQHMHPSARHPPLPPFMPMPQPAPFAMPMPMPVMFLAPQQFFQPIHPVPLSNMMFDPNMGRGGPLPHMRPPHFAPLAPYGPPHPPQPQQPQQQSQPPPSPTFSAPDSSSSTLPNNPVGAMSTQPTQSCEQVDTAHLDLPFPSEKAGLIFGRSGRTLNSLKRETGAKIQVDVENGLIHISASTMRAAMRARTAFQHILASSESLRLVFFHIPRGINIGDVCFVRYTDPSLRELEGREPLFVLAWRPGAAQSSPLLLADSARQASISTRSVSSADGGDNHMFSDMDELQLRSQLSSCLDALKPNIGQVEVLCRFGKMIFTRVPNDVVDVPFPRELSHQLIRTHQMLYTFEGGAGIPDSRLERAVHELRSKPGAQFAKKSVYYLSVLPETTVSNERKRRLDLMMERTPVEGTSDQHTVTFCGVREPYMKPFKADLLSLETGKLDMRIAVRASPLPITGETVSAVKAFAETIQVADGIELECPKDSKFRVSGCALKTVETIREPSSQLAVELIQHEGQPSQRTFEFTATLTSIEDMLGKAGVGIVSSGISPDSWSSEDLLGKFDDLMATMSVLCERLAA